MPQREGMSQAAQRLEAAYLRGLLFAFKGFLLTLQFMKKILVTLLLCAAGITALAQENKTPEQQEKEFYEAIENQVTRLTEMLELDDAQVFYLDSILTHDYKCMQDEFGDMSAAKVSNSDLFYAVQDKWMEQIYQSVHKILSEEQWNKYLKAGAARDKKAREKRASKKNK